MHFNKKTVEEMRLKTKTNSNFPAKFTQTYKQAIQILQCFFNGRKFPSNLKLHFETFLVDVITNVEVKRTSSTETYLHGLYKYTNYSVKVLAFTGAGDGILSTPLFCRTEEDGKFIFLPYRQHITHAIMRTCQQTMCIS